MSKKAENTLSSGLALIEEWIKGTLKMHRVCSFVVVVSVLLFMATVGNNVFVGFLQADWMTTILLGVITILGIVSYFVVRQLDAIVMTREEKEAHQRSLINPKTLKEQLEASLREILMEMRRAGLEEPNLDDLKKS